MVNIALFLECPITNSDGEDVFFILSDSAETISVASDKCKQLGGAIHIISNPAYDNKFVVNLRKKSFPGCMLALHLSFYLSYINSVYIILSTAIRFVFLSIQSSPKLLSGVKQSQTWRGLSLHQG